MPPIKHVIFDFDGTCTQIPRISEDFLNAYRQAFSKAIAADPEITAEQWAAAQATVRAYSPREGWTVGNTPSAPVACDPYILADESAKLISRERGVLPPAGSGLHSGAYQDHAAPWREEARNVLREIHGLGMSIHFVSNSDSKFVSGRLDELLKNDSTVREAISVESGAGKFLIKELSWGGGGAVTPELRAKFEALPAVDEAADVPFTRPLYLRRGSYFEALCRALGNDVSVFGETLVCGDVWELDLAMPFHLGMHVHLIERAEPFGTYEYERAKVVQCGSKGGRSEDLKGLLARLKI